MDLVVTVPRLPRPGETVLGERLGRYPGGKGANQAVAAARLGGQVAMVGRVGADDFGPQLVAYLTANGVDASGVEPDSSAATGAALIFVSPDGQNMIAVAPGANGRLDTFDIERAMAKLQSGDVLLMQLEIPITVVGQAIQAARLVGGLPTEGAMKFANAAGAAATTSLGAQAALPHVKDLRRLGLDLSFSEP